MKKNENTVKVHEPFSPTIVETQVPKKFIDIINSVGDEVLSDESKSAQWDWSNRLVGKVHKEVLIPIMNEDDGRYCKDVMKTNCTLYLKELIKRNRGYVDTYSLHRPNENGNPNPTNANINLGNQIARLFFALYLEQTDAHLHLS